MKRIKSLLLKPALLIALAFVPATLPAADFSVRFMPSYDFAIDSSFNTVFSGVVSLDFSPLTVRTRDEIYFSLQASPVFLMAPNVDTVNIYSAGGALGYNFRINDRLSVAAELNGGLWTLPEDTERQLTSASGLLLGGRVSANYYVSPILKAGLFAGYQNYYYKPKSFLQSVQVGAGVTIDLKKAFSKADGIKAQNIETAPLFPIFYAHYDSSSFGTVQFTNIEKNDITDVEISVFIEQFMSVPKVVNTIERVKPGEEFSADFTAFLNESIMNQMQNQLTDAVVTVSYKSLGQRSSFETRCFLQTLTRNSMSWEDDRQAAAFVSAKDGAIQRFARQITLALRDRVGSAESANYLYARAVFEVLKTYGINYVVDPTSVFSTSDTVSVDFLQFPYQTLLYHGGDYDDLSILNCSLFEALGIESAFITIPGHIYMAYDSGLTASQADRVYGKGKYIVQNDKVWIPFEITVPQDTFELGLKLGMRQWNKYSEDHNLIPIHEAWTEFKPVTVPESDVSVQFPKEVLKNFK